MNYCKNMNSPIGNIEIMASNDGITSISIIDKIEYAENTNEYTEKAYVQLKEYFEGKRKTFDLEFDISGTAFREKVWKELTNIPFGETISYKELAKRIGNNKAIRAVGGANNKNPIGIVIPCHRVIGADGSLVGYARGLDRKKWLLDFEKSINNK